MTGQPDMFDFDHPSRFLPFADPAHEPDWSSRDDPERPDWLTRDEERFTAYCLRQLDELDRRAKEPSAEVRSAIDLLWTHRDVDLERLLPIFLDNIGWTREQYRTAQRRKQEEYETEATRTGPTRADPSTRNERASAAAAQDIAKLRFVIFPRFWDRKKRSGPSADEIAASRHGCTRSEAESWYENDKVRKRWASVQV